MEQLILHLIGDYVTQSDWMANNKTKAFWPAFMHALVYSLPFLWIASTAAWWVIFITHFFIDRYRLIRYVVWIKNQFQPEQGPDYWGFKQKWRWENCSSTGYPSETPAWLAVWLMIAADNTLHLAINFLSIKFL